MPKSEVEKLFEETQVETDVMEQPLNPELENKEQGEKQEVTDEELGEAKRRRERRLMEKLQAERESNIALSARLEALSEAQKLAKDSEPSEYLKKIERIYGTDSAEAQAATQLLAEALQGVEERAYTRALEAVEERQREAAQSVQKEERTKDGFVEEIEDSYSVTMTPEMKKGYFQMMEKLSPKDSDGNIIAYADPHSTWELFQEKIKSSKGESRQKDLASRAMAHSGSSTDSKIQDDAHLKFLKENGII